MKKRKDKRYQKRVPDKYVENGAPRVIYGNTPDELDEKFDKIKKRYNRETILFNDVADEWQDSHFENIRYNTTVKYTGPLKQIKIYFENDYIFDITPKRIQEFINSLADKNYARDTVKVRLGIIRQIFNYAIVRGYIDNNATQAIKIPKGLSVTKKENVSSDVIETIHNSLDKSLGLLAYILLYTGCRLCEAAALQWSDVDFDNNIININKIIEWRSNQPYLRENTKTTAGNRQIILSDNLREVLFNIKDKNGYIINIKNKPISKTQFRKNWAKLNLGITAHQLRHEYATMLYNAGVDVKAAQALLGHSSITVTMNIYTHLQNKKKEESALKINEYLQKNRL